ncbi:uncharacterized protein Z520_11937 [Fonsecaea multimorphosa CBS 102226]|uniref:Uncharacterized protein n=1 Tax=Fonsecaea multimorphosa CBS 102226 TaxID=1442371 RepID=A0A0D2JPD5_9EURO|nr:uncharacterized protein Z520_11937 [Fonsecaea multimorphosa CBS 102226]KIX92329.1 hypothetical protein Z520_11937 [Fonsecaea multimorphosa CBS 102226]OAL17704.1 hypothetical protein AYO22_11360 [Fonsecaea multimorphosa]
MKGSIAVTNFSKDNLAVQWFLREVDLRLTPTGRPSRRLTRGASQGILTTGTAVDTLRSAVTTPTSASTSLQEGPYQSARTGETFQESWPAGPGFPMTYMLDPFQSHQYPSYIHANPGDIGGNTYAGQGNNQTGSVGQESFPVDPRLVAVNRQGEPAEPLGQPVDPRLVAANRQGEPAGSLGHPVDPRLVAANRHGQPAVPHAHPDSSMTTGSRQKEPEKDQEEEEEERKDDDQDNNDDDDDDEEEEEEDYEDEDDDAPENMLSGKPVGNPGQYQ